VLFCDRQQFVLFFFFVEKRNEREKNRVKKNVDTLNKNWSKKKRERDKNASEKTPSLEKKASGTKKTVVKRSYSRKTRETFFIHTRII
jgi:hypothetical protein